MFSSRRGFKGRLSVFQSFSGGGGVLMCSKSISGYFGDFKDASLHSKGFSGCLKGIPEVSTGDSGCQGI